jgi:hypothetical protein
MSHKTVGIKVFSHQFCLLIEGSGSIPLTNGSGSGRPKNMWILQGRGSVPARTLFIICGSG